MNETDEINQIDEINEINDSLQAKVKAEAEQPNNLIHQ